VTTPTPAGTTWPDLLAALLRREDLDPEQLRRVIVESAVEATQADGGVVMPWGE